MVLISRRGRYLSVNSSGMKLELVGSVIFPIMHCPVLPAISAIPLVGIMLGCRILLLDLSQ